MAISKRRRSFVIPRNVSIGLLGVLGIITTVCSLLFKLYHFNGSNMLSTLSLVDKSIVIVGTLTGYTAVIYFNSLVSAVAFSLIAKLFLKKINIIDMVIYLTLILVIFTGVFNYLRFAYLDNLYQLY